MAIDNMLVFSNEKGGVLKSTGASHLAGYAAAAGWDVLAIDADRQANQSRDLGYRPDEGKTLAAALMNEAPLRPVPHPRFPTLHYVSGGKAVDAAIGSLAAALAQGQVGALRALERAVAPIASNYHLIVVDSPPSELLLRRVLFCATRFVVVPCQVDAGSIDGIAGILETVHQVRDLDALNPRLEVLGAFLGPIANGAGKTARTTAAAINGLVGDPEFVFSTTIRSAQSIATYCREHGILSHEYEQLAGEKRPKGRAAVFQLSDEERAQLRRSHTFSSAATGLATDWQELVGELMDRFQERLGSKPPTSASPAAPEPVGDGAEGSGRPSRPGAGIRL